MQNSFQIVLVHNVEKTLRTFPLEIEKTILNALQCLKISPLPDGNKIKKLKTLFPTHCELKEGDYSIIFRVEKNYVIIKAIVNRKDLERELKRIK